MSERNHNPTRRRLLTAALGVTLGTSGCLRSSIDGTERTDETEARPATDGPVSDAPNGDGYGSVTLQSVWTVTGDQDHIVSRDDRVYTAGRRSSGWSVAARSLQGQTRWTTSLPARPDGLIVSPDSVVASVRSGEDTEYERPRSHAFEPTSGTEKWTVSGADSIGTASGEGDIDIIDSAIQTGNLITLVRLGSGPDSTEFLGFYDEATGQQRSVRQLDGAGGMATAANEVYITAYDSDDYEFEIRIFESASGEPVETVVPAIQGGQRITALEGRDETLVTNAGIVDRSDGSVRATVQIRGDVHSIRSYPDQSILTGVLGVTSVDPTTGAKHWEQQTDGEVAGAPVLTPDAVWVADSFGTLYAFDRTTGRRLLQWDVTETARRIAFTIADGRLLCAAGDRLVAFDVSYRESGSTARPTPLS